jgi:hypothetical protein
VRSDGDYRQGQTNLDRKDLIMQLFGKQAAKPSSKSRGGESRHETITSQPKVRSGRERLVNFGEQIEAAEHVIGELTEHVARLRAVVVEAQESHRALQECIAADGGVELAKFSSGQCKEDDPISQLVKRERTSAAASAAASAGIPHAESLLAAAKQQLVSLTEQQHSEVMRVIELMADDDARSYQAAFDKCCLWHDKMAGYAQATEGNIGDTRLIIDVLKVPRYALPSMGDSLADPFLRHHSSPHVIDQSAKRWLDIKAALEANPNCDLAALEIRNQ